MAVFLRNIRPALTLTLLRPAVRLFPRPPGGLQGQVKGLRTIQNAFYSTKEPNYFDEEDELFMGKKR